MQKKSTKVVGINNLGHYKLATSVSFWHEDWLELVEQEPKDFLQKFIDGEIAVNIKTKEEYDLVLGLLETEEGLHWDLLNNLVKSNLFEISKGKACIWVYNNNKVKFETMENLNKSKVTIMELEEFINDPGETLAEVKSSELVIKSNVTEINFTSKPFEQSDLEVGMLVELDHGNIFLIPDLGEVEVFKDADNVVKIFKLNDNGNYIKIWEKPKEKLYTLHLPYTYADSETLILGEIGYFFGDKDDYERGDYQFTQGQIDLMEEQDFIKTLIKTEVEGE